LVLLERAACRAADVVVNAERIRARLMKKLYGLSKLPIWVWNSLPLDFEVPARDDGLRKALLGKASDEAILVICPSLVSPERRSFELIRAISLLPEKYRLVTIARLGGYGEACRRLAEEIGVGERVVFLPPMPFHEVMAHIATADVGVVLHDGAGSVGNYLAAPMRLSQMAVSGIPLVASALPAVEAIVYRHNLGICCDDSCPAEIARAIRELCETSPGPRERGLRARTAFEKDFHFEKGAHELVEGLRRLP
jgi:glycosyltransferase involved in cell wall biosynthesis